MNKFCKLLGALRVLKGFRQTDIAYQLNTTSDKISHFEKGADPSVLDDCRKTYITVQSYNIAKNYEYPRAYAGKIISVEKIC